MERGHVSKRARRFSRRAALHTGAAVAAAGASLATGTAGATATVVSAAAEVTWHRERLEVDFMPRDPVSGGSPGGGAPVRGDHLYMDGPIYARDDARGDQTGTYHAFGVWTSDASAVDAPYQLLATVQFRLFGTGSIMGMSNGGGTEPAGHEGAIQGGTGRYAGAQGTFRQQVINDGPPPVVRVTFDLILPE